MRQSKCSRSRNGHFDSNQSICGGPNPLWRPSFNLNWTMVNKTSYNKVLKKTGPKHRVQQSNGRIVLWCEQPYGQTQEQSHTTYTFDMG